MQVKTHLQIQANKTWAKSIKSINQKIFISFTQPFQKRGL